MSCRCDLIDQPRPKRKITPSTCEIRGWRYGTHDIQDVPCISMWFLDLLAFSSIFPRHFCQVLKTPGRGVTMRNKPPFLQDGDWYLKPRFWAMKSASRLFTSTWPPHWVLPSGMMFNWSGWVLNLGISPTGNFYFSFPGSLLFGCREIANWTSQTTKELEITWNYCISNMPVLLISLLDHHPTILLCFVEVVATPNPGSLSQWKQ